MELKDDLIETLYRTDQPVLTVAQLADEVDASTSSVEKAVADLVAEDAIIPVEVGDTTAYHIYKRDHPIHQKPDHYCKRCGREVHDRRDSARVEIEHFFTNRPSMEDAINRKVLCRFCYHDLVSWLHNDEELMHIYPHLDEWDVPEHQKEKIEQSSEYRTSYPGDE